MNSKGRVVWRTTVLGLCAAVAVPLAVEYQTATGQTGRTKPDDNRFTTVVLVPPGELDEPMAFEVLQTAASTSSSARAR